MNRLEVREKVILITVGLVFVLLRSWALPLAGATDYWTFSCLLHLYALVIGIAGRFAIGSVSDFTRSLVTPCDDHQVLGDDSSRRGVRTTTLE